jgi:NAD(P)-dependent dehydrogenase (short-subunit alcohol dehydrogenase family)
MPALSRSVVVVGAGPGLGAAIARRFAREGFVPVLLARDPDRVTGEDLAHAVRLPTDAADPKTLAATFAQVRAAVGDPGVLVFNPSLSISGAPSEVEPDDVARGLALGAVAAVTSAHAVLPAMRAVGAGTLLFTGSGVALKPFAPMVALGMQKAALRSYVLALADEVGPLGIHAATVTIRGVLGSGPAFAPEAVAEHFWTLHAQPPAQWQTEVVLAP